MQLPSGEILADFLPRLASTFLGIILGVPVALWLARKAEKRARASSKAANTLRLRNGLASLSTALQQNAGALQDFSANLSPHDIPLEINVDVTAWDVTKQEIVPYLENPDLERRIANHFGSAERIGQLLPLLQEQTLGVASALSGAQARQSKLRHHLQARSDALAIDAQTLANEVDEVRKRLESS